MSRKFRWTITGYWANDNDKVLKETFCIIDGRPELGNEFSFTSIDFDGSLAAVPDHFSSVRLKLYDGRGNIVEELMLGQVRVCSIDADVDFYDPDIKHISYIIIFRNITYTQHEVNFESCKTPKNDVTIIEE
jgi:hypothetical protein